VWHDSFICATWLIHRCKLAARGRTLQKAFYHTTLLRVPFYILSAAGRFDTSASSHVWMSHVTHMNASCHTYEWDMPHMWMSHVTHMNESCHTYEWVMSHIWMRHAAHMNEPCYIYEWVMSISHVRCYLECPFKFCWRQVDLKLVNLHTYEWVMLHLWMSHATHMK